MAAGRRRQVSVRVSTNGKGRWTTPPSWTICRAGRRHSTCRRGARRRPWLVDPPSTHGAGQGARVRLHQSPWRSPHLPISVSRSVQSVPMIGVFILFVAVVVSALIATCAVIWNCRADRQQRQQLHEERLQLRQEQHQQRQQQRQEQHQQQQQQRMRIFFMCKASGQVPMAIDTWAELQSFMCSKDDDDLEQSFGSNDDDEPEP